MGEDERCANSHWRTAELQRLTERVRELEGLLKVARCPDSDCTNGVIPHQVDEDEWEAQQCQWCYEREHALEVKP